MMDVKRVIWISVLLNILMMAITKNVFINTLILDWYYSKGTIATLTYAYIIFTIIPLIVFSALFSFWYFRGKVETNIKQGFYLGLIFIFGSFVVNALYHLATYLSLELFFNPLSYFNIVIEMSILFLVPIGVSYLMKKS